MHPIFTPMYSFVIDGTEQKSSIQILYAFEKWCNISVLFNHRLILDCAFWSDWQTMGLVVPVREDANVMCIHLPILIGKLFCITTIALIIRRRRPGGCSCNRIVPSLTVGFRNLCPDWMANAPANNEKNTIRPLCDCARSIGIGVFDFVCFLIIFQVARPDLYIIVHAFGKLDRTGNT